MYFNWKKYEIFSNTSSNILCKYTVLQKKKLRKQNIFSEKRRDESFPRMTGNLVELQESFAKRATVITRKCARGADRSGSAKRPHFRFVRQSVSCGWPRHCEKRQPLSYFWVGLREGKGQQCREQPLERPGLCLKISLEFSPFFPLHLATSCLSPSLYTRCFFTLGFLSPRLSPLTAGHVWLLFLWILRKKLPWVRLCLALLLKKKREREQTRLLSGALNKTMQLQNLQDYTLHIKYI